MPGFVTERYGYTTGSALIAQVVTDMLAHGFTIVYKSTVDQQWNPANAGDKFKVILEAGPDVDPLNATSVSEKQPWRVCFDVQNSQQVLAVVGTPTTLPSNGTLPVIRDLILGDSSKGAGYQATDIVGVVGEKLSTAKLNDGSKPDPYYSPLEQPPTTVSFMRRVQKQNGYLQSEQLTSAGIYSAPTIIPAYITAGDKNPSYSSDSSSSSPWFLINENYRWVVDPEGDVAGGSITMDNATDKATKCFINRPIRMTGANLSSYPMSYRLVISNRGMWIGVWEDSVSQSTSTFFNWFLVQRPVDRTTGETLTTGKAPVFCVNGIGNKFWKFTVRERDIFRPSARIVADTDSEDSEAIFNSIEQVSLSEDGKYIVTFPSRLNTSRYRYPHELDMIATTSADVVSQNTDVPLTVYGEAQPRLYRSLHATGPNNTGMRILILQSGGSIS